MGLIGFFNDIIGSGKDLADSQTRLNQVIDLEMSLGITLPSDYRQFLLNGKLNVISNNTADVLSRQDEKVLYNFVITKFLGVNRSSLNDLRNTWLKYRDELPKNYLPIAFDKFRNIMIISLDDGSISFADLHNVIREKETEMMRVVLPQNAISAETLYQREIRVYWVSNSFHHFVDSLYSLSPFS